MASKATQAILLQDVEKLGRKGDVVHVAPGYMRNYLAPRKLAEAATDARVSEVQRQAEQRRLTGPRGLPRPRPSLLRNAPPRSSPAPSLRWS